MTTPGFFAVVDARVESLHRYAIRASAGLRARLRRDARCISVAIPTYDCSEPAEGCLDLLARDARIDEVCIRDDASSDEVFDELQGRLSGLSNKFRIARNAANVGALANKWHTVRDCRNEWVLLLDADNAVDRTFLDVLFGMCPWDPETIYCPEQAKPRFDFARWASLSIDLQCAQRLLAGADMKFATTLLNTGNYFFARRPYLERVEGSLEVSRGAPDVLVANYAWLRAGGVLRVVRGLRYEHRIHAGSNYRRYEVQKKATAKQIRAAIARSADIPESLFRTGNDSLG